MTNKRGGNKLGLSGGAMTKLVGFFALASVGIMVFFTNCNEKLSASITSEMSTNLSTISAAFNPPSYDVSQQSNPCNGVTDFAVCESNSAVQYLAIGKTAVAVASNVINAIGQTVGEIPDNNSGITADGKIQWNKTSRTVWTAIQKGTGGNPVAHITSNSGVYVFKYNATYSETSPRNLQIEGTFNFSDSSSWTADLYVVNGVCDSAQPQAPSKSHFRVTRSPVGIGLWAGKAMHYFPRWQIPGATVVNCAQAAGISESTLYSDYTGDSVSTKAAIYVIPASVTPLTIPTGYGLPNFCNYFPSACGGSGQPNAGALSINQNNFCSTTQPLSLTWNNNCPTNATVAPAPFASDSLWTAPADLETYSITVPSVL